MATVAGGADGRGSTDSDSDTQLPPRVVSGGRKKQMATIRPQPSVPDSFCRVSQPTDRYRPASPPKTPRIVVKKRKVNPAIAEPTVVEAFAVPVSEQSNRVLVGKLDIYKRFSKGYMSSEPIKQPPLKT